MELAFTDKFVLLALADNANDQGSCWPSIETIVRKTSLSERAVHYAIKRLTDTGYISLTKRTGNSSVYHIRGASDAPVQDMHHQGAQEVQEVGAPDAPRGARGAVGGARGAPKSSRTIKESSSEPSVTREGIPKAKEVPRGTEPESEIRLSVMAIKAKYPRAAREDWITAEKRMRQIVMEGGSWHEIEGGVERYQRYCRATNRMVQNPANFFGAVDRPWLQAWALPTTKAESLRDTNIDASQQWLREQEIADAAH